MGHFQGFWGQKGQCLLEKSEEMPHYCFSSDKKISRALSESEVRSTLVFLCLRERERKRERKRGERERERVRERTKERKKEREKDRDSESNSGSNSESEREKERERERERKCERLYF
jgi:hypothetical protein